MVTNSQFSQPPFATDAKKRRISGQTDTFLLSESDSESCESEPELPRTRSGSLKTEDADLRVYRKRQSRSTPTVSALHVWLTHSSCGDCLQSRQQKRKEDDKDEPARKKAKKSSAGESDEEEDSVRHPRGRDFDLNEIRNELKGISQAIKPSSAAGADKDPVHVQEVQSIKQELIDVKVPNVV